MACELTTAWLTLVCLTYQDFTFGCVISAAMMLNLLVAAIAGISIPLVQ
ncbi:hypothetical protein [Methyloprofundus sedimenti]|nr:hypothetical protein [Methyloprofundus sedimenti]